MFIPSHTPSPTHPPTLIMFATCQSIRAIPLAAAPKRVERRNVRATRVHASTKKDDVESSDSVMLSRRALGVSSVALGAAFAQNLTFATPAEAKKIISGYTDLAGVDVSACPCIPVPIVRPIGPRFTREPEFSRKFFRHKS